MAATHELAPALGLAAAALSLSAFGHVAYSLSR
jgi:hypothetical protein